MSYNFVNYQGIGTLSLLPGIPLTYAWHSGVLKNALE
jgi:hypothetical protein